MLKLLQHDQSKIIKNAKHDMYAYLLVCLLLGAHDTSNSPIGDIRWTG